VRLATAATATFTFESVATRAVQDVLLLRRYDRSLHTGRLLIPGE
jgi:hypothetical protein